MFFNKLFSRFSRTTLLESGFCNGLTDRHSHLLPGLDDGVRTMPDALQCLDFFEQIGFAELYCTPHVMEDFPNTTEAIREKFDQLKAAYQGPIQLHLGAEYMLDHLFLERLRNRDLLVGDDGWLMVETFSSNPSSSFIPMIEEAMAAGYKVMIAHPERYHYFANADLEMLCRKGMRLQINIPSLLGAYGPKVYSRACDIIKMTKPSYGGSLMDAQSDLCFGSDCHTPRTLSDLYNRPIDSSLLQLLPFPSPVE